MPGEDDRDIDREQLGRELLPVMDKLARVNSGGVEPLPATRKLGDPAQQPTRAGKSLSQRQAVTIQVKPQDISIIFRRPGLGAREQPARHRKPQNSQEKLSRIFKLDIFDSRNSKVVSEARKAGIEPEVSDNVPTNMFLNQTDDEHKEIVSNVNDLKSDAREVFANKTELPLGSDKTVKEVVPENIEQEVGLRKPEGRSLDFNTTQYKYYVKDDEVIKKEVAEENVTKTNLIHKAVVINRPVYDHNHRVGQLSSSETGGSNSLKRSLVSMSQSNLVGLGLGVLLFLLTLAGTVLNTVLRGQ